MKNTQTQGPGLPEQVDAATGKLAASSIRKLKAGHGGNPAKAAAHAASGALAKHMPLIDWPA